MINQKSIENEFPKDKTQIKIAHYIHKVYFSKWLFYIIFIPITLMFFLQLYLFIFQGLGVSYYFDRTVNEQGIIDKKIYFGDPNSWLAFSVLLTFPTIGYGSVFLGEIFIVRIKQGASKYIFIGRGALLIFAFLSGIFFGAFVFSCYIVITFYNRKHIKNYESGYQSAAKKGDYYLVLMFYSIFLMIGLPLNLIILNDDRKFIAVFDVIGSASGIVGWYLITKKSKWGFVFYTLDDFLYFWVYFALGSITAAFNLIIYFFLDFTSGLVWFIEDWRKKQQI